MNSKVFTVKRGNNFIVFVVSLCVSLGVAEFVASFFVSRLGKSHMPAIYVSDHETGYSLKKNFKTKLQINGGDSTFINLGAQNQRCNSTEQCSSNKSAISAFGDSFTFGWGVEDFQTWPAIYEGMIDTSVTNFGVGGYNLEKINSNIQKRENLGLLSETVIVGISYNDLEEGSDVFDKSVVDGLLIRSNSKHLVPIRNHPVFYNTHLGSLIIKALTPSIKKEKGDLVEDSLKSLEKLIANPSFSERKVVFLFFNTPSHIKQVASSELSEKQFKTFYPKNFEPFERLSKLYGFTLVDTTKLLANEYRNNPVHNHLFVENDQHYNSRANQLIASKLFMLLN